MVQDVVCPIDMVEVVSKKYDYKEDEALISYQPDKPYRNHKLNLERL